MSVIYFFLTAMYQARIYSLCLFKKIKQPVLFSCKLITEVTGNSPRETAVDIVLDISENSHGNVYSEVLSEVVAYEHGVY